MRRLAFRQAVAALIDRDFVTGQVLQGAARSLSVPIPSGNTFWHNPSVTTIGHGLSRAQRIQEALRLLGADGFTWDTPPVLTAAGTVARAGKGLRRPDGVAVTPVELVTSENPARGAFTLWIEKWLLEVGIPVRRTTVDANVLQTRTMDRQDMDMFVTGGNYDVYPEQLFNYFHSRFTGPRSRNFSGYNNPDYDRQVEAFVAEADDMTHARQLAFDLQTIVARDVPILPLFEAPIVEAYRSDRVRFPATNFLGGLVNGPLNVSDIVEPAVSRPAPAQ